MYQSGSSENQCCQIAVPVRALGWQFLQTFLFYFIKHPFLLLSFCADDDSRRGDAAAEEPAERAGGAGPSGCSGWLRSPQPADGAAKQTG